MPAAAPSADVLLLLDLVPVVDAAEVDAGVVLVALTVIANSP
jgi:hypothetical protein